VMPADLATIHASKTVLMTLTARDALTQSSGNFQSFIWSKD